MSEKRKVTWHEGCNYNVYRYSDIIDYEHCRFCKHYHDNWYEQRFECDNVDRYEGDYCFEFDYFRCRAEKLAEKLENVKSCRCGGTEILFVNHKPWFFNTYYIKCPKCETKTKRSWFRSWAFKRWEKIK